MLKETNYGKTEKEIRSALGVPLSSFKEFGISSGTLSSFEKGESILGFEKLKNCLNVLQIPLDSFVALAEHQAIFKGYGEVFQQIREQRSFELEMFEHLGLSTYILQMFEEGRVMLPFDKLDAALQLMHVSLEDFSHIVNKGEPDYFVELFNQIEFYDSTRDKAKLQKIFEEAKQYPDYRLIALAAKGHLMQLSEEEIEEIGDFLIGIDVWTSYGVSIFLNTIHQLSVTMILLIMNEFAKNHELYEESIVLRRDMTRAIVLAGIRMMDAGKVGVAGQLLKGAKELLFRKDCYASSLYTFGSGYYLYCTGKEKEGDSKMKDIIHFFGLIGDRITQDELQELLNRIENGEPALI